MPTLTVTPAYGRDYTNVIDVQKAWDRGDDFHIVQGPYVNKHDIEVGAQVIIKYAKNQRSLVVTKTE